MFADKTETLNFSHVAKVTKTLGAPDPEGRAQVMMRVTVCRKRQIRLKSGIIVPSERWDHEKGRLVKPRADRRLADELSRLERLIGDVERAILDVCETADPLYVTKNLLEHTVAGVAGTPKRTSLETETACPGGSEEHDFFNLMNVYASTLTASASTKRNFLVVLRILERFARYKRKKDKTWGMTFGGWDSDLLNELYWFLGHEPDVHAAYPDIYESGSVFTQVGRKVSTPPKKGENTKNGDMKRFRTFWRWAMRNGHVNAYPFRNFEIKGEVYGTPFYLTRHERDTLAGFDLSARPGLLVQRDIFIFHCLTGCRVSDLRGLRQSNVMDGGIEYIPKKTLTERAQTVRVPLNAMAQELVDRYEAWRKEHQEDDPPLFPFISDQKYNKAIKEMLRIAGIDRPVTVLNPLTRQEERRPICEVASSHMARRTFIGILYKQVKDPNLVGSLSGHKEGSRAFIRYRDIDEDMKKDLVDLL